MVIHSEDIKFKLDEAMKALLLAEYYMKMLNDEAEELNKIKLSDKKVMEFINELIPLPDDASKLQEKNSNHLREYLNFRYFMASDLIDSPKSGRRFINAVSDFLTHVTPLRNTIKKTRFLKPLKVTP